MQTIEYVYEKNIIMLIIGTLIKPTDYSFQILSYLMLMMNT